MDYMNDPDWEDAHEAPVSEEQNGRFVRYIQEQSAIWQVSRVNDPDGEKFNVPVLVLDIGLQNGEMVQVILQPSAVTSLNGMLADHWGRMWGMLPSFQADLSDEALDRLMNDIKGDDNGTGV